MEGGNWGVTDGRRELWEGVGTTDGGVQRLVE